MTEQAYVDVSRETWADTPHSDETDDRSVGPRRENAVVSRETSPAPESHPQPVTIESADLSEVVVSRETSSRATVDEHLVAGGVVSRETLSTASTGNSLSVAAAHSRDVASADHFISATRPDTPIAREAAAALEVLNVRHETWPRPPRRRVITVANQKGGVGKTTSAVNVAATLALHGLRVLVIDLDPQGNASTALGMDHSVGTPSIYDALLGGQPLAELARPAAVADTLWCVPATIDLAGSEIELTSQVAREFRLRKAIEAFEQDLDYVFVDCPPSLGLLTLNALVAAKEVMIPIQCEYYALEGLAQLLSTVDLVRAHLNPSIAISTVLLTMYDSRTRLADQVADEVRQHFGELVIDSVIPRNVRVSEAPGFGQTVITYDPGSRGAISYVAAAREIAERGAAMAITEDVPGNSQEAEA